MKKHLHKFETTMWLGIKILLYASMMASFIKIMGIESIGLTRLSRTLGITITTFMIVGGMFLSIYGQYDVGRRKSKPIIYSLSLSAVCTDIVTYLQLMIMRTNTPSIKSFRLLSPHLLALVFVVQVIIIIVFVYAGNALFFKIHVPENCCIITSSQEGLDKVAYVVSKIRRRWYEQYLSNLDALSKAVLDRLNE